MQVLFVRIIHQHEKNAQQDGVIIEAEIVSQNNLPPLEQANTEVEITHRDENGKPIPYVQPQNVRRIFTSTATVLGINDKNGRLTLFNSLVPRLKTDDQISDGESKENSCGEMQQTPATYMNPEEVETLLRDVDEAMNALPNFPHQKALKQAECNKDNEDKELHRRMVLC